jgi:hypothetical protein
MKMVKTWVEKCFANEIQPCEGVPATGKAGTSILAKSFARPESFWNIKQIWCKLQW